MGYQPYVWIPARRMLDMSKWVSQGAEAASPNIPFLRDINTHRAVFATLSEGIQDIC